MDNDPLRNAWRSSSFGGKNIVIRQNGVQSNWYNQEFFEILHNESEPQVLKKKIGNDFKLEVKSEIDVKKEDFQDGTMMDISGNTSSWRKKNYYLGQFMKVNKR